MMIELSDPQGHLQIGFLAVTFPSYYSMQVEDA
jgi:hypothetical protein